MFKTYFTSNQLSILTLVIFFHIISLFFFIYKKNNKYALFFLIIGGLILRLLMISFDEFLHTWDEQYHALVAKNMTSNPIVPILYKNNPLSYDQTSWTINHIWLHKQPFFLWQMALFLKIFGVSAFTLRLPSAVMSLLLIPVIYRIGKITINESVGYLACFIYATSNYQLDFITGFHNTDHNDVAFIFYVTISIWAYTEYLTSGKKNYLWIIGAASGIAILNKWLVGILVYSGWGISLLFISGLPGKITEFKNLLKSFLVCLATFIPWQIYILLRFPIESKHEYEYGHRHFVEVIENHTGDTWYHFNLAIEQYGSFAAYLLPLALIILFIDIKNTRIRISYIVYVILIYSFFTLAKTKMPAFCLITSSILFLSLGNIFYKFISLEYFEKTNKSFKNILVFISLIVILFFNLDITTIQANHTPSKQRKDAWYRAQEENSAKLAKAIKNKFDKEKTVIFNCNQTENIQIMFFTDYTAYDRRPSEEECNSLKSNGYKIIYIDDYTKIPEYIKNDSTINIIKNQQKEEIKRATIFLKSSNENYVCADGFKNNNLFANRIKPSLWETFSLTIFKNNECSFIGYNNNYLSAELGNKAEIIANREGMGSWEVFTLIILKNNLIALKADNNKYLTVDEKTGQIFATADNIGKNETFELILK